MPNNILICLYSTEDTSRNFPALIPPGAGVTLYDVSVADMSTYFGPPWSSLPTFCLTVNFKGVPSPTMVGLLVNPPDWATVANAIASPDNTGILQSISAYGTYQGGTATTGPLPNLFNQGIVLVANGLNPVAQQQIPLITNILADSNVGPSYWANLQANPPVWLDTFAVDYVNTLIQLYSFPTGN